MDISTEDSLRLHVLLNQSLEAVRIDEGSMVLHALTSEGEAKVALKPNCRDDQYLRKIRELLSTHVLGSPGGYPIYLRRWTRMGQARSESLDKLLALGEPEAVVAVVHAPGLTGELARRAWWAMPNADNARQMLENTTVVDSPIGRELAAFLIEFLPFEENPKAMLDSVRLVLKPGLIDTETRQKIWNRAGQKNTYFVGFLQTLPNDLPERDMASPLWNEYRQKLEPYIKNNNPVALHLEKILGEQGQTFLRVTKSVLKKPRDQEVVVALFDAIGDYFAPLHKLAPQSDDIETIRANAESLVSTPAGQGENSINEVLKGIPEFKPHIAASLVMTRIGESLVAPVFSRTDAIGSVMRKKLEPITTPILQQLDCLLGTGAS